MPVRPSSLRQTQQGCGCAARTPTLRLPNPSISLRTEITVGEKRKMIPLAAASKSIRLINAWSYVPTNECSKYRKLSWNVISFVFSSQKHMISIFVSNNFPQSQSSSFLSKKEKRRTEDTNQSIEPSTTPHTPWKSHPVQFKHSYTCSTVTASFTTAGFVFFAATWITFVFNLESVTDFEMANITQKVRQMEQHHQQQN